MLNSTNHTGATAPDEVAGDVHIPPNVIEEIARRVVEHLRRDLATTAAGTVLPQLLTPKETADALGISERQLQILAQQDGRLRPIRISKRSVRYPAEQIEEFVRSCAKKGRGR